MCEKALSAFGHRLQPIELKRAACSEVIHERRWEHGEVDIGISPVGAAAIGIGKAVLASKLPGAAELTCSFENPAVLGQRRDGTANEQRRLGLQEVFVFLSRFLPISLGDAKIFQHRLST